MTTFGRVHDYVWAGSDYVWAGKRLRLGVSSDYVWAGSDYVWAGKIDYKNPVDDYLQIKNNSRMNTLTVRSVLLNPFQNDKPLTPAMVLALWVIADAVDKKLGRRTTPDEPLELTVPTSKLRGTEGRNDNRWLKVCLDRMTGLKIGGTYRGNDWGAVILSEWRLEQGGSVARLYLPPSSVYALRAGDTFAKIETYAAYRLQGYARTLYGALADKKNMGNSSWRFDIDELRYLMNVGDKKSYKRFNNFKQKVLDPALEEINDFGTVAVKMKKITAGNTVTDVEFSWEWKTIGEARETDEENQRPKAQRGKVQVANDAPPLTDDAKREARAESDRAEYRAWLAENPNGKFEDFYDQKHGT